MTDIDQLVAEETKNDPEFAALWQKTAQRRALSQVLVRLRKGKNLTQKQLAARAGWDQAFVSRLESATGGWPDLHTLRRYAWACGEILSIAFGTRAGDVYNLDAGIALADDGAQQLEAAQVPARHSGY